MSWHENIDLALKIIPIELLNTVYMVMVSAFCAFVFGFPIGVLLYATERNGLYPNHWIYRILGAFVNIGRSIPFAILIVAIIPITRWIVGTSLGTTASIVPLTLATIPFMARVIEGALKEVSGEVIEAAVSMGAPKQIIVRQVLLPESLPTLINGIKLAVINLIGYSALAGLIGGGGLGKIAIQYGYQRFNSFIMILTLIILVLLVESVELFGNALVNSINKKRGKG